jgi:hypothetical protein
MNSQALPSFWQMYRQLPPSIRQACRATYRQFMANPAHPGLQFHRLGNYDPRYWSVRITRDYRAVGILMSVSHLQLKREAVPPAILTQPHAPIQTAAPGPRPQEP